MNKHNKQVEIFTVHSKSLCLGNEEYYYLGHMPHILNSRGIQVRYLEKLTDTEIEQINQLFINLDSLFDDEAMCISNTCCTSRYLSTLQDNFLVAYAILKCIKSVNKISVIVDTEYEKHMFGRFLSLNGNQVSYRDRDIIRYYVKQVIKNLKYYARSLVITLREHFYVMMYRKKTKSFPRLNFITWVNDEKCNISDLMNANSYFGLLPSRLNKDESVGLIGHICGGNKKFHKIVQINAPFIEEYICFKDIIYSICKNFVLIFGCDKKIFFKDYDYSCLVSDHMKKEFFMGTFVNSLLLYRAFKRFFDSLLSIEEYTIVYPFENQPWEKGLLKAAREQTKKINLFAYQFFPIARNLILHSFSKYVKKTGMIPARILTSDIYANNIFIEQGIKTFLIGSARFGKLLESPMKLKKKANNKILCCLFLDSQEAFTLTYKAIEISRNLDCLLVINYHKLLAKKTISEIKMIIEKYPHVGIVESAASELLEDVFVVLYNSSSVCFEAALRGVPILYVACENLPNLDRFNGLSKGITHVKEGVFFIRSLIENEELYGNYSYNIYKTAKSIILPLDFAKIENLFSCAKF